MVVQQFLLSLLAGPGASVRRPGGQGLRHPARPEGAGEGAGDLHLAVSDGQENRSAELGGTIPRNTGPNTASGTKGLLHQMDVYVTWFSSNSGRQQDPVFPAIVDTVMLALRYSQPNPAQLTDPATNLTSHGLQRRGVDAVPHWG